LMSSKVLMSGFVVSVMFGPVFWAKLGKILEMTDKRQQMLWRFRDHLYPLLSMGEN